tara:strand:- start:374 stop:1081 length:708 start_codon:yes stop_codon:yes gene_type:complete
MEKILSFLIDVYDKNYHQLKIFNFLKKIDIKIIFDIGAHKGEFLKSIKKLKHYEKIYSFEPQKKIYEANKQLNVKDKIDYLNIAISDYSGLKKLKINKKSSTSTFSEIDSNSTWYKIKSLLINGNVKTSFIAEEEVKTITLDDFCFENKVKKIDLLKIDTEGHEKEVLTGAGNLFLNKKIKYILIEFHSSKMYKNYDKDEIENLLLKNNFILLKKFKFLFLAFEDRLYCNKNFLT